MKTALLVVTSALVATACAGTAFASSRSHHARHPAPQATMSDDSMQTPRSTAGSNHWRAPVGAKPYTHDLPSTDGSDR